MTAHIMRVSDSAWDMCAELGGCVRISVLATGCYGKAYHFTLDAPKPGDALIRDRGATFAIASDLVSWVTGAKLEYKAHVKPPRFTITHGSRNRGKKCSCNRSFGEKPLPERRRVCHDDVPMEWDRY